MHRRGAPHLDGGWRRQVGSPPPKCPAAFPRLSSAVQPSGYWRCSKGSAFHFPPAPALRMLSHGAEPQWGGGVQAGGFSGSPTHPSPSLLI